MSSFNAGTYDGSSLSRFYANVFMVMSIGLLITGAVTMWLSSSHSMMETLFNVYQYTSSEGKTKTGFHASAFWWGAAIAELILVIAISWGGLTRMNVLSCLMLFGMYSILNGVTLAPLISAYTTASVMKVFFITAGMFSMCAMIGYTTKINLLPLRSFFLMSLIGLLIVLIVNIFLHSPMMDFIVSCAAVLLFAGLTAFDMQKLREMFNESSDAETPGLVVYGALTLYLDFINMFIHLLRLLGSRDD